MIQDLDLLLPLIEECRREKLPLRVFVHRDLPMRSPRVTKILESKKISFRIGSRFLKREIISPVLFNIRAVVTAVETNQSPHLPAFKLVRRAKLKNIPTITLQHGFENIGLTYSDEEYSVSKVSFLSDVILTWQNKNFFHKDVSEETRSKCVPVGLLKEKTPVLPFRFSWQGQKKTVAIFENLHWKRFSESYRSQFLESVVQAAQKFPDFNFFVKPHHAGGWLIKSLRGKQLPNLQNLIVADPNDPQWEPFTGPSIIQAADFVLTTPSTIAVDAVLMQKPVAVFKFDLELDNYRPLPLIERAEQVFEFLQNPKPQEFSSQQFLKERFSSLDGIATVGKYLKNL
jgi:hypothetical protein